MADITIVSCSRFNIDGLSVRPAVLGRAHHFVHDGHEVEIKVPTEQSVQCCTWELINGEEVPFSYPVVEITMLISHPIAIRLNEMLAYEGRVDKTLATPAESAKLNRIASRHEAVANQSLDYWIRVMRWKTRFWRIGQRHLSPLRQGTELLEGETQKRFWAAPSIAVVPEEKPITLEVWEDAEDALREAQTTPTWFDFLFEAQHRMHVGDKVGCIIKLAIACETMFRGVFSGQIPDHKKADPHLLPALSALTVSALMKRLPQFGFWDNDWKKHFNKSRLRELFNHRNVIMHLGTEPEIDETKLKACMRAAEEFIHFADERYGACRESVSPRCEQDDGRNKKQVSP